MLKHEAKGIVIDFRVIDVYNRSMSDRYQRAKEIISDIKDRTIPQISSQRTIIDCMTVDQNTSEQARIIDN